MLIEGNSICGCALCGNNKSFNMPDEIIESVKNEELILFCGAGISTESKNVLPISFYMDILSFLNDKYSLGLTTNISFSELMSTFCNVVPNGRKALFRKIKERLDMVKAFPKLYNSATRFHKEVAKITQINTIVTTNWDDFFEKECATSPIIDNIDIPLWNTFSKKVFKIHGSINNIGSIVATKEDYQKCYERLEKEPIGDRLKTLLSSHCVVFIGFSFGDEDLNKIIDILSEKLGEFANQYYLVTLDETWRNNKDTRILPIITDGSFFMHSLNNILKEEGVLLTSEIYNFSEYAATYLSDFHSEWTDGENFLKKLKQYPELLLSVAYQNGMIHAYQRCSANKEEGTFLKPGYLLNVSRTYNDFFHKRNSEGNYTYGYYDFGYSNGFLGLQIFIETSSSELPPMFTYNENFFDTEDELIEYIMANRVEEIHNYCKKIVTELPEETIPHFPPWYC